MSGSRISAAARSALASFIADCLSNDGTVTMTHAGNQLTVGGTTDDVSRYITDLLTEPPADLHFRLTGFGEGMLPTATFTWEYVGSGTEEVAMAAEAGSPYPEDTQNWKAIEALETQMAHSRILLGLLGAACDDHYGAMPMDVTYAHAGSAAHVNSLLETALEHCGVDFPAGPAVV